MIFKSLGVTAYTYTLSYGFNFNYNKVGWNFNFVFKRFYHKSFVDSK